MNKKESLRFFNSYASKGNKLKASSLENGWNFHYTTFNDEVVEKLDNEPCRVGSLRFIWWNQKWVCVYHGADYVSCCHLWGIDTHLCKDIVKKRKTIPRSLTEEVMEILREHYEVSDDDRFSEFIGLSSEEFSMYVLQDNEFYGLKIDKEKVRDFIFRFTSSEYDEVREWAEGIYAIFPSDTMADLITLCKFYRIDGIDHTISAFVEDETLGWLVISLYVGCCEHDGAVMTIGHVSNLKEKALRHILNADKMKSDIREYVQSLINSLDNVASKKYNELGLNDYETEESK